MSCRRTQFLAWFLVLAVFGVARPVASQETTAAPASAADDAYQAQRKFAIALLKQQKQLEALPVFESLAKQNPNDAEVLFGWGACLVNHSATLPDPEAGRQERLRARQLLLRAKELGNNNLLLLNLLDLLPADGSAPLPFSSGSKADEAMRAGEAAFAKNDYDEAIKNYSRALELDPKNYEATLFVGDSYFAKKNFPDALIWYDKAIALNPDVDTAFRYEADMLMKSGEMEKARTRSIQAVVANPYSQVPWRYLNYWATSNKVQLTLVHIDAASKGAKENGKGVEINLDPKSSPDEMAFSLAVWMTYSGTREKWEKELFKAHFKEESHYRHSLAEEVDALSEAAKMLPQSAKAKDLHDPNLVLLKRLSDAAMFEPYVLLSAPDRDIAMNDYAPYRALHREQLEAYLSQFVVPPTPPKP